MALASKTPMLLVTILVLLRFSLTTNAQVFDIRKYGAKGDGQSDISKALLSAWKDACAFNFSSKVVIPYGTFLLREVTLEGPCNAPIAVQLQGTVKAPANPSQFKSGVWVAFRKIDDFYLFGGGTFDGQGKNAWPENNCAEKKNFKSIGSLPINLRFDYINNSIIDSITSLDSKQFHINVIGCENLIMKHITVSAPGDSPNTDGIHIGRSNGIIITDTNIKTGDDCISFGDGSKNVTIKRVTCGPGHGISIGSLGMYSNEEPVEDIYVRDCTLTNTENGIRIKTWPNQRVGSASNLRFENIQMNNVSNPVLIDQVYCPWGACNVQIPSHVKINQVVFKGIKGTTPTQVAVKMVCSKQFPCNNVKIGNINLRFTGGDGDADDVSISECVNVHPFLFGMQNPLSCAHLTNSTDTTA